MYIYIYLYIDRYEYTDSCIDLLSYIVVYCFIICSPYMACPQHEARSFGAACGDRHRSDRGTDKDWQSLLCFLSFEVDTAQTCSFRWNAKTVREDMYTWIE